MNLLVVSDVEIGSVPDNLSRPTPTQRRAMLNLCLLSYRTFLRGDYATYLIHGEFADTHAFYRHLVQRLWDLHLDHTLLNVDADTLCVRETTPFCRQPGLHLYSRLAPSLRETIGPDAAATLPADAPYLNAGVKLIPQRSLDELRLKDLLRNWDGSCYDYEQQLWNRLYWAQTNPPPLDPRMNWGDRTDVPKGCPRHEAQIVHYHMTRDVVEALGRMVDDWTALREGL